MKFNKITDPKEANYRMSVAMKEWLKAKRKDDPWGMALQERTLMACGGSIQQAEYPTRWWFWRASPSKKYAWQRRRNEAQRDVDSLVKAFEASK